MFQTFGFCILLLCSLQQATSNEDNYSKVWYSSPVHTRNGVSSADVVSFSHEKLQEVFQSYPVDRRNTDQTLKLFRTCEGLSGRRETEHAQSYRYEIYRKERLSKPCYSVLRNCRRDRSMENDVEFCVSLDPTRRYDYMESVSKIKEKFLYGHKQPGQGCASSKIDAFFPYAVYNPCICDCESSEKEVDRYFSLAEVVSDDDKVVTGIRIRKIDHVFYIQIQQGTLGPHREISGKCDWKDVKKISKSDIYSDKVSEYYNVGDDRALKFHKNNFVYAVTGEQNTMLLDDLEAGPNEVVTGLSFQQVDNDLRLKIMVTPFDYETGTLKRTESRWIHNEIDKDQRKRLKFEIPNIPSLHYLEIQSPKDSYAEFQVSDFKEDLGQTTVPFIATQDVARIEQPLPLFGAGIFHKGSKNTAGYIVLKGMYKESSAVLSHKAAVVKE